MSNQPEALRLADRLEAYWGAENGHDRERQAAAELRRLHAVNIELLEALDEVAINTHDDTAERVARAAIAKAEAIEAALKEKNK